MSSERENRGIVKAGKDLEDHQVHPWQILGFCPSDIFKEFYFAKNGVP